MHCRHENMPDTHNSSDRDKKRFHELEWAEWVSEWVSKCVSYLLDRKMEIFSWGRRNVGDLVVKSHLMNPTLTSHDRDMHHWQPYPKILCPNRMVSVLGTLWQACGANLVWFRRHCLNSNQNAHWVTVDEAQNKAIHPEGVTNQRPRLANQWLINDRQIGRGQDMQQTWHVLCTTHFVRCVQPQGKQCYKSWNSVCQLTDQSNRDRRRWNMIKRILGHKAFTSKCLSRCWLLCQS
jgi:hypothetical protein